jgi:hypothetical protein
MAQTPVACPDCADPYEATDNYCRNCGMFLAAVRETALATRTVRSVERYHRERAQLPAPVKRAVTAVAVGAALQVGVSLASKYLAAQAGQKAANAALGAARAGRAMQPAARHSGLPEDIAAVSETVVVRRLWIRRP